jgi:hypothetical protein
VIASVSSYDVIMKKNSEILINFADKFLFSDPNKILMSYNYIINDGAHLDTTEPKNKVEYINFINHWSAISINLISGVLQRYGLDGYLSKEEYAHTWGEIYSKLAKQHPLGAELVAKYRELYNSGGTEFSEVLSKEVFNDKLSKRDKESIDVHINKKEEEFEFSTKRFLKK